MSRSDLELHDGRVIPADCLEVRFARGGGPGGQHVNRTESKVDLRLDLSCAEAVLGEQDAQRLRVALQSRLDGDGRVQVVSSEHRSQHQNLAAAQARLVQWIAAALRPRKKRRPTKPTRGSQERRLGAKRRRSAIKRDRRGGLDD
jgi:ribosome-associated protein